jgi:hypothetical protein
LIFIKKYVIIYIESENDIKLRKGLITMEKTITLPLKDFKLIFEGFEAMCDRYAGAKCVEETYMPIYNKYLSVIKEEK